MVLQVSVTACEMVAEAGSGGSLYTAYMVEARSNPLQPSWIVRRRFRSPTLLLPKTSSQCRNVVLLSPDISEFRFLV